MLKEFWFWGIAPQSVINTPTPNGYTSPSSVGGEFVNRYTPTDATGKAKSITVINTKGYQSVSVGDACYLQGDYSLFDSVAGVYVTPDMVNQTYIG